MARTRTVVRRTRRRRVAVAMVLVLALTGCSQKTSSDQTVTTRGGSRASALEPSDLKRLLPQASVVGADYRIAESAVTSSDTGDTGQVEGDGYDAAFAKGCPAAYGMVQKEKNQGEIGRTYTASEGRKVEVSLALMDPATADFELDELRKALSSCSTISGSEAGTAYTIGIHAESNNDRGDKGVIVTMDFTFTPEAEGVDSFDVHLKLRFFRVGEVGITISVLSGLDTSTLTEVPGDFGLLDSLGARLASDARDLQQEQQS